MFPEIKSFKDFTNKLSSFFENKNSCTIFYIILSLVLLYILHGLIFNGLNTIREGQTNMGAGLETLPQNLKNKNIDLEGNLLLQNRRQDYEDTILALDDAVNLHMLRLIKSNAGKISEDSSKKESRDAIVEINELYKLRESLNEAMKYLDKV